MSHIEQLVARQVQLCDLRHRVEEEYQQEGKPSRPREETLGPCLFVSREYGSGGGELARRVGERLDWHVFDREIVETIAQRAHVRAQLIESIDERTRSRWAEWLRQRRHTGEIPCTEYVYHLRQVVFALAHLGHLVLLGRGANFILPSQGILRVRVIAPLTQRIHRVSERRGVPPDVAEREVEKIDAGRLAFMQSTFSQDPASPLHYDLVINTGEMSVDRATPIVLTALHEKLGVRTDSLPCAL